MLRHRAAGLWQVDDLLGIGARVFVMMHKSVMTPNKVVDCRHELRDFCKKVRQSSEAPLVQLKGKQLCLVLATDYIPHGELSKQALSLRCVLPAVAVEALDCMCR